MGGAGLDAIFSPRSIAVIGASRHRGKIGYEILRNLVVNDYQGPIYPVNPKAASVHGIPAYARIIDVPGPVDLAIITVPAEIALTSVDECGRKGVRGLVVITAGFREVGDVGARREAELLSLCRTYGMTMVGPNCMGVINTDPAVQMDATFAPTPPLRGTTSLVTQSGALGVAILDHAKSLGVGFAKFCSLGNKAQVSLNDLLRSWGDDPATKIVLAYIENFGNPMNFVRIAREVSKRKPIIAVKSGRSEAGGRAAASHTGALGGSDLAAEAAFNQTGVLRANSIEELFDYAMAFTLLPLPAGDRVAIVSDAGGPAIMCVDELVAQGLRLAALDPGTVAAMKAWAPPEASLRNPVDLTPQGTIEDYRRALDAVLADPGVDAAIAIYVPPVQADETEVARAIWQNAEAHGKPVLCNFLGRKEESPGFVELVSHGVPSYLFPENAARSLAAMHRYAAFLKRTEGSVRSFPVDRSRAAQLVEGTQRAGRARLTEEHGLELLRHYGIRGAQTRLCRDVDAAAKAASEIGYPVVVKAVGEKLLHKTEQRAVLLDVRDEASLRTEVADLERRLQKAGVSKDGLLVQEYVRGGTEVFLGMVRDKVYGPFLVFGLGGIYVEYLKDVAFGIPPLTDQDALRMIRSIRTYPLLEGVRGEAPRDVEALSEVLQRFSQLVLDQDGIEEVDVNPLIALERGQGCQAVDVRALVSRTRGGAQGL